MKPRPKLKPVPPPAALPIRWIQSPPHALVVNYQALPLETTLNTRQAARLLRLSLRRVQSLCDEGTWREGRDWWTVPGRGRNGNYRIRLESVRDLMTLRR